MIGSEWTIGVGLDWDGWTIGTVEAKSKGIGTEPIKIDVLGLREVVVEEGTKESVSAEGVEKETSQQKVFLQKYAHQKQ